MRVIAKGRTQAGWSRELTCTGKGNGGGGCGAKLLVEQDDLFSTASSHYDGSTESYVTFRCVECGVDSDTESAPPAATENLPTKKAWLACPIAEGGPAMSWASDKAREVMGEWADRPGRPILRAIERAIRETIAKCAEAAGAEKLEDPQTDGDLAYDLAVQDCAKAIRKLGGTMSDEKKPAEPMSEKLIERNISIANRLISLGHPAPLMLAALETSLVSAWEATDAPVMLELLREHEFDGSCQSERCCPECLAYKLPHTADCRWGALLGKHGRG